MDCSQYCCMPNCQKCCTSDSRLHHRLGSSQKQFTGLFFTLSPVAFDRVWQLLDTSSAIHFRSTPLFIPNRTNSATFNLNAQHHGSLPKHLQVVYSQLVYFICARDFRFAPIDTLSCKTTSVDQIKTDSTILITACRTFFCHCSASRHTICSWGLRATFLSSYTEFDAG